MTELALPDPKNDGAALIANCVDRITPRLPPGVDPTNFVMACMAEANALTRPCTAKSVATAAFNSAVVGLIPGSALGHAYFVPYGKECTLVIGYRGFLDLAFASGFLVSVHAEVVLNGEQFRHWNNADGPQVEHEIPLERDVQRQNVAAAYCTYRTRGGGHGVVVVSRGELNKVDSGKNVWKSDYVSMAKKTAIRRAAKEWQLTSRLARAVELDEQAERGATQATDEPLVVDSAAVAAVGNLDDLED